MEKDHKMQELNEMKLNHERKEDTYDDVVACGSITFQSKTVWGRYSLVDTKKKYGK